MRQTEFIELFRQSLKAIREPRFFQSERGYQGALIAELRERLREKALFPGDPIVEQEYQKRLKDHGITIRPDLIIHIPYERGFVSEQNQGNFVAIEMKCRATPEQAKDDFNSLKIMKERLGYPITIFLNISSRRTFAEICPREIADQTFCFSVELINGDVIVTEGINT